MQKSLRGKVKMHNFYYGKYTFQISIPQSLLRQRERLNHTYWNVN
ncbi:MULTISPECIES: hypothetical protein [unclassified Photobacterium]|nr:MULTISPECIES: hypothetical protein [unclassified Photobacterium]